MRTVLITGATSGFGKKLVTEFLKNGDRVIATGRRLTQRSELLKAERATAGSNLIEKDLDVTDAKERQALFAFIESDFSGQIDILVNNAGYGLFGALEDSGEDQLRAQMEVNFFGLTLITRDLLPALRKAKGKVFNFSSVLGFVGFPLTASYCASKFAVEGLTEALAFELAPHGVQVCLIEPGSYRAGFGTSVMWSDKVDDQNSAFYRQSQNYQNFRNKMMSGPPRQNVDEVPLGVVALSNRRKLPLRVRFGKDSRSSYFLKRLLPTSTYFKVLKSFFSNNINRGL